MNQRNAQLGVASADGSDDAEMARWLGRVLRTGVILAAIFVLIGLILFITGDETDGPSSLDQALGRNLTVERIHPDTILQGLRDGVATAYVQLGILILILTPTLRVAVTAFGFARRREQVLTVLASVVLFLLLLGLAGIGA